MVTLVLLYMKTTETGLYCHAIVLQEFYNKETRSRTPSCYFSVCKCSFGFKQ